MYRYYLYEPIIYTFQIVHLSDPVFNLQDCCGYRDALQDVHVSKVNMNTIINYAISIGVKHTSPLAGRLDVGSKRKAMYSNPGWVISVSLGFGH